MKLLRLRLENFRQHTDTDVSFGSGMTAIVGPNGSGKSTLVEAIGFALYGEQRDKKETVRFHWGKGKRFAVTLDFEYQGRQFRVERTHAEAHLTQVGEPPILRAHGLTETTRACERLLGLNFDQFLNSFWAEQKGLAFLQFRTNAARQEEVARMLGFDRLRLAEEVAAQRRREAAVAREALERTRVPAEALLERQREAKQSLTAAKARLKTLTSELATRERESAAAAETRALAERWLDLDRRRLALVGEISGLSAVVEGAERALSDSQSAANELRPLMADALRHREAVARLLSLAPVREAMRRGAELSAMADGIRAEIEPDPDVAGMEAEVQRLKGQVQDLDLAWGVRRATATGALASLQTRLEISEQALGRAEAAAERGVCPECGQPLSDPEERVREYREKVARLSEEVEAARKEAECQTTPPAELQALRERLGVASTGLERARAAFAQNEQRRARLHSVEKELRGLPLAGGSPVEVEELEGVVAATRTAHERALALELAAAALEARLTERARVVQALSVAQGRRNEIEREQLGLPFSTPTAATEAVARAQALAEETAKLRAEHAHASSLRDVAQRDLDSVRTRIEEQKALEGEIEGLRTTEALHDTAAREMRTLRQELNVAIGPDLAARGSENLALLTNGRYLALELDRNFSPSVIEDGVAKPVISGGEEDVVALALRLALSELIQERQGHPMSLLILDEVFGSLDAERRQSVLDRLTALRGRFEQILVITHLEEVHQVADQTIQLRRDPSTRSSVVGQAL